MGDMTLRPVLGQDGVTASFASGDDPAALYSVFAAHGGFPFGSVGKADAAHGAVAVTVASLAPGEKKTLSLVFAWHFPDRDFSRIILGNMYTELWADSAAVAQSLASESKLASVVADINSHHYAIASPQNPTPVWLKDQLLNQWSHFHVSCLYASLHPCCAWGNSRGRDWRVRCYMRRCSCGIRTGGFASTRLGAATTWILCTTITSATCCASPPCCVRRAQIDG
jgi:uncharacterized protein YejL (UPF0352 family)